MSTKTGVVLTGAAGLAMAVLLGLDYDWWGVVLYASVILLPLIVGRWWVVASLLGPLISGVALQLTGHMPESESNGGLEYDFGFVFFVLFLILSGNLMMVFLGVRKGFDFLRKRRQTARA